MPSLKQAGTECAAIGTVSLGVQPPTSNLIPVPSHQFVATMVAIGAASSFIVDISGVGVMDTILYRDSAGIGQRL